MSKQSKEFVPGQGYTKEDWDAEDSPELTDDEIAGLLPAREFLPPELFEALTKRKPGQRGPQKAPTKAFISLRIDQDVLERFFGLFSFTERRLWPSVTLRRCNLIHSIIHITQQSCAKYEPYDQHY